MKIPQPPEEPLASKTNEPNTLKLDQADTRKTKQLKKTANKTGEHPSAETETRDPTKQCHTKPCHQTGLLIFQFQFQS